MDPDAYNGADRGAYRWSQTHQDLDVQVVVPKSVVSSGALEVLIRTDSLLVRHGERDLVSGKLKHAVRDKESFWTLLPGQHVHVQLEKARPRWWTSLLEGEPPADVPAREVPLEELRSEEAMVVEKLRWQDLQKQQQRAAHGDQEHGRVPA
ncbi:nudC domain-containing protein 3-like [Frankliniella occidentalis]|uniref:NudC domain-containing protein 3-like n=1 Tax=Frankliniella occidentalis TaxID=133901 RepID=A0A6J1S7D9_FRAOC|nr:nudC domain-containing protein 3-like [Frankliniella occidentalis]